MINANSFIGKDVVLAPFCLESVLMYHKLKRDGVKVSAFFDRNPQLWSKAYDGVFIMRQYHRVGATVIVCSKDHEAGILAAYKGELYSDNMILTMNDVCTVADDIDSSSDVDVDAYKSYAKYDAYFRTEYIDGFTTGFGQTRGNLSVLKKYRRLSEFARDERKKALVLSHFSIIVTTRCTLKCKSCGAGIQYIEAPMDFPIDDVIFGLDAYVSAVDYVGYCCISGGETLLYKDLLTLLQHIADNGELMKKVGVFLVLTNGTIIPSTEIMETVKKIGGCFFISNYCSLSKKLNQFVQLLNENDTPYIIADEENWRLINCLVDYEQTTPENDMIAAKENRDYCAAYNWPTTHVFGKKLYPCLVQYSFETSHALPYDERNTLDLSIEALTAEKLLEYSNRIYPGCAWCSGGCTTSYNDEEIAERGMPIPVAEQTKSAPEFRKYL